MRLVIDTNVWIHYLIRRPSERLDAILFDPMNEILRSRELLEELFEVCVRPKFMPYLTLNDATELVMMLESRYPVIEVSSTVDTCRDKKDNFLLSLCKDGQADYLITGDNDLLVLHEFDRTTIVTIREFEKIQRI